MRWKVTSRKPTTFLLHSIIISSLFFLSNDWKFFFIRFDSGPLIFLNTARSSSLYKPMSFLSYFSLILFHIKMPTDSQTSAPSYALIVTSNRFPSLIIQGFSLRNKSDFLAWHIIYMSSLLISVVYFAKLSALVNSFSDIEG